MLLNKLIKYILKIIIEFNAKLKNKGFYCMALSGFSDYDISINCDMTVSCNCKDYDGAGIIGDLTRQDIKQIFDGSIASKFRRDLAKGKLPTLTCARCDELNYIDKNKALYFIEHYDIPRKGIMVENTINCNLSCLSCQRKSVYKLRKKNILEGKDIKYISLMLKKYQIECISYFNLGEPFMSSNIYDEIKIIRNDNPNIFILVSTNGTQLNNQRSREAAMMLDHIVFSIDGINDDMLRKYQKKGSFNKSFYNMKDLVEFRDSRRLSKPIIEWKYVLFNWNDKVDAISEAIKMAKSYGVDIISFWPTKNPFHGISWRYYINKYYKSLGSKSWKGRELVLRPDIACPTK